MLKFLIISFLVLYLLYSFSGKIMQFLAKILIRRMEKQVQNQFETATSIRKEGEITVEPAHKKTPQFNSDTLGEYVEFEEVK